MTQHPFVEEVLDGIRVMEANRARKGSRGPSVQGKRGPHLDRAVELRHVPVKSRKVSDDLEAAVEAFLAGGGEIEVLEAG